MAKDNEILKKTLRHYIDLEYYANGVAEDLDELLEALYQNCDNAILANDYLKTKADYNAVHSVMEDYFSDFQTELNDRLEKEAETVKENERDFLSTLYGAALTVGAIAASRILFAPFDGRDTVKTFAERSVKNIRRAYDTAVRSGYMFGQSSAEVKEQAGRNLKQITRWINNGITTAIPSFAKTTDRIVFLNNDVEVVWVATLDGNQCLGCTSLNGTRYKSIADAPMTPHANCRCQLIRAKDITEPIPTYQEYIESLDDEEQYHILGKNRYELYKTYGIELKQFINNGNVVPLDELDLPATVKVVNSGAKSEIINKLNSDDILKIIKTTEDYYAKIRSGNNKDLITRIANNSGKSYSEIEQIVNHIFKNKHKFENGSVKFFDPSADIVKAFERLRTGEHTDSDILLLNHEFAELTYMRNKKYNVYENAHKMANRKYNWEEEADK